MAKVLARWFALLLLAVAASGCRAPAPAPAAPPVPGLPTSASVGGTNIVAISPPAQQCCPKQTLPQFLGISGLFKGIAGIIDRIRNRLGTIWPGLEAKPEVLAIADPANLESANPAVSAAAEIKAEEDAAAQKAKAIAYLASVGCAGCYPNVEEAMLAALDDCTELIRFETAKALRSTAAMPCKNCCRSACCGPKIREKLEKLAYGTDSQGCYLESSDRVRRMARLALAQCTCVPDKPGQQQPRLPEEGPAELPPPEPTPAVASVLRTPLAVGSGVVPQHDRAASTIGQPGTPPAMNMAPPVGVSPIPAPFAVGGGSAPAPHAGGAPASAVRTVSYEEAVAAFAEQRQAASPAELQLVCEIWTARSADVASRTDALALMALARAHLMSSQPGQRLPVQLQRTVRDWLSPRFLGSPALARAAETTPVGGVSGVVEDHSGWHLVRVLDRRLVPAGGAAAHVQPPPATAAVALAAPLAAPAPPAASPPGGRIAAVRQPNCDCR